MGARVSSAKPDESRRGYTVAFTATMRQSLRPNALSLAREGESPRPFLIIGAQKAGTTSLYSYLAAHPDIYGSPIKEPKYFLNEQPTANDRRAYYSLFEGRTSQRRTFEATPHYTQFPGYTGVPQRIAAELPDAQLIYIIRHPIERTYSHYMFRLTSAEAREFRGFEEALDLHPFYTYISRYHSQLEQYLEV